MKFGLSEKNKIPLIIIGVILDLIITIPEFLYEKFKRKDKTLYQKIEERPWNYAPFK